MGPIWSDSERKKVGGERHGDDDDPKEGRRLVESRRDNTDRYEEMTRGIRTTIWGGEEAEGAMMMQIFMIQSTWIVRMRDKDARALGGHVDVFRRCET